MLFIPMVMMLAVSSSAAAAADCSSLHQPRNAAGAIATENAWVRALENRDVTALSCILAPGFADAAWNGNVWSRQDVLSSLPSRKPHPIHLSNIKVQLDGDAAVVRGVNTQPSAQGTAIIDFTDMFKYRQGRWQAVTAQEVIRR